MSAPNPSLFFTSIFYNLCSYPSYSFFFFLNNPAPPEFSPLPHPAAPPISLLVDAGRARLAGGAPAGRLGVHRRAGEQPQRLDPLGELGVRAEQLGVAPDPALRFGHGQIGRAHV